MVSRQTVLERKWLVRASGMILGPFTLEELSQELKEKKVSLIDEVRLPATRWAFAREVSELASTVQWIREQQLNQKEDTSNTEVDEIEETVTQSDPEKTPPPRPGNFEIFDSTTVTPVKPPPPPAPQILVPVERRKEDKQATVDSISENESFEVEELPLPVKKPAKPASNSKQKPKSAPAKSYVYSDDKTLKARKKSGAPAWLWVIAIFIAIGVGGYLYTQQPRKTDRNLTFNEVIRLANYQKVTGSYDKALDYYRKAENLGSLDVQQQITMMWLELAVEKQASGVRARVEELGNKVQSGPIKEDLSLLTALTYVREGRWDEGLAALSKLMKDSTTEVIRVNHLLTLYLARSYEKTVQTADNLLKAGAADQNILLIRAMAGYFAFDTHNDKGKLERFLEDVSRYSAKNLTYRSQALLVKAAYERKLEQPLKMNETLETLLSDSPWLSDQMISDLRIDQQAFDWENLKVYCDDILKLNPQAAVARGLNSYCKMKRGEVSSAVLGLEEAIVQYPTDPNLMSLQAAFHVSSGQTAKAKAVLQTIRRPVLLTYLVKARLCADEHDLTCAKMNWDAAKGVRADSIEAAGGLAWVANENGDKSHAQDLVRSGMLLSTTYRPLVELQESLNEK